MTKKQLLEKLKDVPDDMDVFLQQTNTEFSLSMLESATVREVNFSEGTQSGSHAKDKVCVLADD